MLRGLKSASFPHNWPDYCLNPLDLTRTNIILEFLDQSMRRSKRLSVFVLCAIPLFLTACADRNGSGAGLTGSDAALAVIKRRRPGKPDPTPVDTAPVVPPVVVPPVVVPPVVVTPVSGGCVLQKADAPVSIAFCETFDQPAAVVTKAGQLNQTLWGVSRLNTHVNPSQGLLNDFFPATITGCGGLMSVLPPHDVRICNGRVYEAANDAEGQTTIALYPKQPFDFTGRTGTVSFDVSLDSQGPHAAWPEFWITDKPVPAPSDSRPGNYAWGRNEFGVSFSSKCGAGYSGIDRISTVRNYVVEHVSFTNPLPYVEGHGQCFKSEGATGRLNHVEIRMNASGAEVYVSEPGSTTLILVAKVNVSLPLTRGLVWLVDAHYNANKFDTQGDHEFAWDNLAFDGPKTYRDLGFDVADSYTSSRLAGATQLGYNLEGTNRTFQINGVYRVQAPTGALAVFNYFVCFNNVVPSFRFNGGPWHDTPTPYADDLCGWRAIDVSVPVSEVHDGTNTIEFRAGPSWIVLSNISLILVAGAPVP